LSSTLRIVRVARDMRQVDLAVAASCSREEVSRLEVGRHRPRLATAEALSDVLGVPVAVLFPSPATRDETQQEDR
jgi:transcriptional regulator with XRE-family HTH domain